MKCNDYVCTSFVKIHIYTNNTINYIINQIVSRAISIPKITHTSIYKIRTYIILHL